MYNNLRICGEHIFRVNEVKYLHMNVDDTLTWKGHIDHVIKSVSNTLEYSIKLKVWFQLDTSMLYIMHVYILALAMASKLLVLVV